MLDLTLSPSPIQRLNHPLFAEKQLQVWVKRDDLIDPAISGNKWRKLKYNLLAAREQGVTTILTFGGAFSNHIYATAAAGRRFGFKTIGIIRGEEHIPLNPTLSYARSQGMQLHYVSRQQYRQKNSPGFLAELTEAYGEFYFVPEGGSNALAVKGCEEIVSEISQQGVEFDVICTACGTGGTLAGVVAGLTGAQQAIGFSTLKGGQFLDAEVVSLLAQSGIDKPHGRWHIEQGYHQGGYANITVELIEFMEAFDAQTGVPLDPVYTAKMMFGLVDLVKNDYFTTGTHIVVLHTGGLQGLLGMREKIMRVKATRDAGANIRRDTGLCR